MSKEMFVFHSLHSPLTTHCGVPNDCQVQLSTTHDSSFALPPAVISSPPKQKAEKLLALVENEEGKYQVSLNDAYQEMAEKTFKGLRRALPLTRQKLDWDKVRKVLFV